MKQFVERIIHFLLIATVLSCSNNKKVNFVKIRIQAPSEKFTEIKVSIQSMLNQEESLLAEATLDSSGNSILKFSIDKPTFASFKIGKSESDIYLEPGYDLNISIKEGDTTYYSGVGSDANNYLFNILRIQKKIEVNAGKYISQLNSKEFLDRLDTLKKSLTQFHQHYIDSIQLPNRLISILDSRNKMRVLMIRQSFQWNYGIEHDFDIPENLDMSNEIPYDSVLLNSGMGEYALLMHFNMNIKRRMLQREEVSFEERIRRDKELPYIVKEEIQLGNYTSYMKEFLLAKNIDYWMAMFGIGAPIDTLYSEFKKEYSTSPYLSSLENRYLRFYSVSPGQPAPNIKGITIQGDTISSLDFKGKVIYVDVWASWCGPCVEEIPYAEKLQTIFKGNDAVVFLNVSVDQNENDWKGALLKHENWKGIQIVNDRTIYKTYNIQGIPRYILIDKKGNIVSADALRPSSKELENEIRKLI